MFSHGVCCVPVIYGFLIVPVPGFQPFVDLVEDGVFAFRIKTWIGSVIRGSSAVDVELGHVVRPTATQNNSLLTIL